MPRPHLAKRCNLTFIGFCVLTLAIAFSSAAQQPDKTEFLKKARQTYYSLKGEGLAEFQCTMSPNWEFLLADQRKTDPTSIDAAIQKLQGLHFGLTLGLDGAAKVTHNELPAESEQVASGLKQVYSGMEQMAEGFFQTWSAYMMSPALPEPGADFQLQTVGTDYRITYKDGAADIVTTLSQDFAMTNQRIKTSEFDSTIKPQFKKGPKGFILAGYQATYRGATAAESTDLDVAIDYQEVNGLQFPQEILLSGTYGATPFKAKVAFASCQATKH
jgi:hypothetical protein